MFGPPFLTFDWNVSPPLGTVNVGEIMNAVKNQQQQPAGSGFAKDLLILFAGGRLTGGNPQQDVLQGGSDKTASTPYSVGELLTSGVTKDVYMNIGGGAGNGWNEKDFAAFNASFLSNIKAMGYTGICFDLESSDLDPVRPQKPPCGGADCGTAPNCSPSVSEPNPGYADETLGGQLIKAFTAVKGQGMKVMLTTQYFFGEQLKYGRLIPGLLAETTDDGQPLIDILAPQLYANAPGTDPPWDGSQGNADWGNPTAVCERSNYVSAFPPDSGTGTALMPVVNCDTTYEELTAAFEATTQTPHPPSPVGSIYYQLTGACDGGMCPCA